jgi:hypothetical protein
MKGLWQMAVVDDLIDCVPDMTAKAWGTIMLGGTFGMGAGLMLANPALCIGAVLLSLAGWAGLALSAKKHQGKPLTAKAPSEEAEEDAAVAAFERYMEAERRFRAMVATDERPARRLLH